MGEPRNGALRGRMALVTGASSGLGRATAIALSEAAFPRMREAGGGTIVNVSSMAGKKGWGNASVYCASKFGLTGLTEGLADEGKEHGTRAVVLYPGAMAANWGAFSPEERRENEPR